MQSHSHEYLGIMSGTSLDGIDCVHVRISATRTQLLHHSACAIPPQLKTRVLALASDPATSLLTLGAIDRELGILFADAANHLLDTHGIERSRIRAIGSHGQTVCHRPDDEHPFTLQIGDANHIAVRTGIDTVADFRRKDMALGGQGAPLVPAFHQTLFGRADATTIILNIGGIANITVLRPGHPAIGYDTGPGNMLMDEHYRRHQSGHFDRDAQLARRGNIHPGLLERLMQEPYLARPYPKSTGRELFSPAWLAAQLAGITAAPADIQRTLCEYSARTIADQIAPFRYGNTPQVLVCGGGAQNPLLMERLQTLLPDWHIDTTDNRGVSGEYMEAMAFAWLAHRFMERKSGNLPEVTGATRPAVLGVLYPAA